VVSSETLLVLFTVGLAAGVVDAIAGGGGLITFPALLLAGLAPVQALATNKIQALASVASSAQRYARSRIVERRTIQTKLISSALGASLGAIAATRFDSHLLTKIAPVMLIGVAVFFLFSQGRRRRISEPLVSENAFALSAALPIGFYDGFFGPGTGSLYATALVILLGRDLRTATAETKILNMVGSLVAAIVFLWSGEIVWSAAIAMSAGGVLGGQLGAHLAIKWGASFIRIALVVVSIALAARLLFAQF
jgi:uncharacterized membrane protein YfcA